MVAFSGGECFLLGNDPDIEIEHASYLGLATRCVTNGYWATSEDNAFKRLKRLKKAGLREINFSTGDFHQKFVPQSNIVKGVLAAVRLGLTTVIVVELQKERKVTAAGIRTDPRISTLLATESAKKFFKIVESPWMPMSLEEKVKQTTSRYIDESNVHNRKGCHDLFNNIVISPNHKLGVCCGLTRELIPELNIDMQTGSSVKDLYRQATTDLMQIWIFVEGPEKILAWVASKDPGIVWQGKYAHHCHACLALYKDERVRGTIKKYYKEKIEEVLLRYSTMIRAQ